MLLALATPYLSEGLQQRIASSLQGTVLRPFLAMQWRLAEARVRAEEFESLRAELDSLAAAMAAQAALADENQTLRELLGLARRVGPRFLPATILRLGSPGSESTFLVNVGHDDGVRPGAAVVSARGLVGRVREVRSRTALAMDWSHPDFRASAMLADGSAFGIVENVRGEFREQDRLVLNGTAYNEVAPVGTLVVTSGLGGVLPRGIPIGRIESTATEHGTWLRSYWLRPAVAPGSVTHVLVEAEGGARDLWAVWAEDPAWAAPDSGAALAPAGRPVDPPAAAEPSERERPEPRPVLPGDTLRGPA
jgi:rod shape-determining protein MreC